MMIGRVKGTFFSKWHVNNSQCLQITSRMIISDIFFRWFCNVCFPIILEILNKLFIKCSDGASSTFHTFSLNF